MTTAVFVDAGYLYAAGSELIAGAKHPRTSISLDIPHALDVVRRSVASLSSDNILLRVYWYDGVLRSGPTPHQLQLAETADIKLRLGVLGFSGRQKGVDSLIVTDLIELARNRAITDAMLLSGDEDVRIAVQIAQGFGVRVHLLGIEPARQNQSPLLRQEADTTTELQLPDVQSFLSIASAAIPRDPTPGTTSMEHPLLDDAIRDFIRDRSPEDVALLAELQDGDSIPHELDRILLTGAAAGLSRQLEPNERVYLRNRAKLFAKEPLVQ